MLSCDSTTILSQPQVEDCQPGPVTLSRVANSAGRVAGMSSLPGKGDALSIALEPYSRPERSRYHTSRASSNDLAQVIGIRKTENTGIVAVHKSRQSATTVHRSPLHQHVMREQDLTSSILVHCVSGDPTSRFETVTPAGILRPGPGDERIVSL